ncbi:hypothetical protein [Malikia spinosa]|uniref:Uncharacterized protein n=1 Tax=Malikia spinosa TaxID=86180 RepID=A0A7C9J6E4_9BURK|nr:hypothetical protein [Malikia spinosa]MYZ51170.1 hypothetical protein [Malikia spinosa]
MARDPLRARAHPPVGRAIERLNGCAAAGMLALVEPCRLACLLVPVYLVERQRQPGHQIKPLTAIRCGVRPPQRDGCRSPES